VRPEELRLSPEAMRAFGYRVVDCIIEHLETLRENSPSRRGTRAALEALLREPPPEHGEDPERVLETVLARVFTHMMHVDHPRFFAFVPGPGNFVGAMADALAAGFNVFAGSWFSGSGPAQLELVVLDWLRQLLGLPHSAGGLFVSGGSAANLTALAAARHALLGDRTEGAVVYFSDQTHSAVERALRLLGFLPEQMRRLPSDERFRLPPDQVRAAIAADRAAGRRPFLIAANAGATNTGAVDPLPELAALARSEGLWLHTDGAYGAAAALTPEGRALLSGLEEVDSLALDPHKWLFQPFECGCVLLREGGLLERAFRILPEYLQDVHRTPGAVNFCDYGLQLTRAFRALKLWMSLKVFGLAAFRQAIERGLRLAEFAERRLRQSGAWEIVSPAQLAVVCFRYRDPARRPEDLDRLHWELVERMVAAGYAVLTSTVLRGRTVLRLCTINPRTGPEEIEQTVARLEEMARL
jgi:aromatic-L-amino-acid decarboxylase